MIVPGNHEADIGGAWYPHAKKSLENLGFSVVAKNMPDAYLARRQYWLPFIAKCVGYGENVVLVGHSSGALAIMRYAQNHPVLGLVLVGACHTDLGDETEKLSGYFDDAWEWEKIRKNAKWIVQFASADDPYIPVSESRYVNKRLGSQYYECKKMGHFMSEKFPKLLSAIKKNL